MQINTIEVTYDQARTPVCDGTSCICVAGEDESEGV